MSVSQSVMVVAETVAQAIDACEKVLVEVAPLPAVTDIERAVAEGALAVWPDAPNNVALTWRHGDHAAVKAAFTQAAHVTKLKLVNNRVLANPIEPRSCIGSYNPDDASFMLIAASQGAHFFHRVLCDHVFRMPREKMQIRTFDIGGHSDAKSNRIRKILPCFMRRNCSEDRSSGPERARSISSPTIMHETLSSRPHSP
jgi:aerobic carbon-monoxide dehydrogenase large subunit